MPGQSFTLTFFPPVSSLRGAHCPCCVSCEQRGSYCSFAHGKVELRNKTRKFADASVADSMAPILPMRLSGDVRGDGGSRFSHFRSTRGRVTVGGPVNRGEGFNHGEGGGRGILDRERRFSAPERLLGEHMPSEADVVNTSPAERARRRTIATQHNTPDRNFEVLPTPTTTLSTPHALPPMSLTVSLPSSVSCSNGC
jgi:hypothetical protein